MCVIECVSLCVSLCMCVCFFVIACVFVCACVGLTRALGEGLWGPARCVHRRQELDLDRIRVALDPVSGLAPDLRNAGRIECECADGGSAGGGVSGVTERVRKYVCVCVRVCVSVCVCVGVSGERERMREREREREGAFINGEPCGLR